MFLPKRMQLIIVNKRFALFLLLVLFGFYARGQVQELYLKGIACSGQEEFPEALEYLEKALSYDSDNANCLLKLAEIHYQTGNNTAALEYLQRLELEEAGRGSYLQSRIHASSGNASEAVKYLESHLNSPYKLPSHIILLEEDFAQIENTPEWRALWNRTWYSEEEEYLREIRYLNSTGDNLQALELVDKRMAEIKDQDELFAARGEILLSMKQYLAAVQSYSRAIEINGREADYFEGRARAYLSQDNPVKAIADLEKVLRLSPENLYLLTDIGRIHYSTEDYIKASSYPEQGS